MTQALPKISIKISKDAICLLRNIEEIMREDNSFSEVQLEIDFLLEGHSVLCVVPSKQKGDLAW